MKTADILIEQAKSWLGIKESDGGHQAILDVYNSQKPLPRGHRMSASEPWCATFVSACAIKTGMTDIIPPECSCNKMIILLKALGEWQENEAVTPKPGWIMFYDWDDNGIGDDIGAPEHVGIVERIDGGIITVIEGNYSNSVKRRKINVNGKMIRGYGVPRYEVTPIPTPTPTAQLTHTVAKGEYLALIAKKYGVTTSAIINANKAKYPSLIKNPSIIGVGWVLIISKAVTGIVVANGGLNVREKPTTLSKKITVLANGSKVTILSQANGWGKTIAGYISMKYVKI